MKKLLTALLCLCMLVSMCSFASAEDYAAYIESQFEWGIGLEDYVGVNLITEYETVQLTDTVTLLHEEYSDTEYEDSIFVQDQYVGSMYDYISFTEEDIANMQLALESLFGYYTEGGADRVYAIMNAIIPGVYASADSFSDCFYAEVPEKGYFGAICNYGGGGCVLMIINETLLYSLTDAAAAAETAPAASAGTIGGGLGTAGTSDEASDETSAETLDENSLFDWGCTAEEYLANNELTGDYQQLDVTDTVSIIIETFSDSEYEGYVFVNDQFAADVYEYTGNIDENLVPTIESMFGASTAGGADRIVAAISAIGSALDLTADQIIDPHYIELADGATIFSFSYTANGITYNDIFAVNEAILFQLSGTETSSAVPAMDGGSSYEELVYALLVQ